MIVVRKLALGLVLAGALTCAAVPAQSQTDAVRAPGNQHWFFGYSRANEPNATQLAHQYVEAKKEDEKREIRKNLLEVLNKQFDQHIQQQQHELEDLEKQIAKLKEVLKKRLDAKSTIVERRLDQLIQDAEGLGWNAPSGPQAGFGTGYANPPIVPGVKADAPAKK
jgi:uncharacterized protein YlxW (UPF0749 family)